MSEYDHGSHTVHDIKHHFVWLTKYRQPLKTSEKSVKKRYNKEGEEDEETNNDVWRRYTTG